jgi:hypothetical protein
MKYPFIHLMRAPGYTKDTKNIFLIVEETGEPVILENIACSIQVPSGNIFDNCHVHVHLNQITNSQNVYVDLIQFSDEQLRNHLFSW